MKHETRLPALLVRAIAVALVLAAPFVPPWPVAESAQTVVFVLDRSASIPSSDEASAAAFLAEAEALAPGARIGLVEVDGEAHVVRWPGYDARPRAAGAALGTDLAGGVRLGAAILPAGGHRRLVVLSDGRGTTGGVEAAVDEARARGVTVDVVALGRGEPGAARIAEVSTPQASIRQGEPLEASARVVGTPFTTQTVQWTRDGARIASTSVELDGTGQAEAALTDPEPPAGVHVYEAALAGTSQRQRLFVDVQGRPQILLVTLTEREQPTLLLRALEGAGEVVRHPLAGGPVRAEQLADADLVVLADLPLEQPGAGSFLSGLDVATQEQLLDYVSEGGGGLLVSGGAFGFGPDWAEQPIARLLPVTIEDQGELQDPPVAMAMMLDGSGSMGMRVGSYTKIRLAVEGCLAAASTLRPEDRVAIASVEDRTRWIQPLAPTGELEQNRDRVRALRAGGGGIYVYTALRDAYAALAEAPEPIRHVVLFSDTADSEEQSDGCPFTPCRWAAAGQSAVDFAREARGTGITTTVVGIGDENASDAAFLAQLAAAGGGRYYLTRDGTDLRRIFVTETRAVSRSNLREEETAASPADPTPMLDGVAAIPPLAGFVQTRRRPTAHTALVSPDDRPLLASWRYGVGTVVAFTSDLGGRWSHAWNDWEQSPQLFRQMVRHAMRRRSARADVETTLRGRVAEVIIDVAEGTAIDKDSVEVSAVRANGRSRVLEAQLERVGPDRYRVLARTEGEPIVVARVRDEGGRSMAEASAQDPAQSELDGVGPDDRALRELARRGGGRVIDAPAEATRTDGAPSARPTPVWPWVLLLAALLVAVDLWLRRLGRPSRRVAIPGLPERQAPGAPVARDPGPVEVEVEVERAA